jgi:hypothetical protein
MKQIFGKNNKKETVSDKGFVAEIKETFNKERIYRARWVWYHTILAGELFLIIILLIAILAKI